MIIHIKNAICEMQFALMHVESKNNSDDDVRLITYASLIKDLLKIEEESKNKNSIIMGDFNANLLENILIKTNGMHAIPYKEVVKKSARVVSGREFEKFYTQCGGCLVEKSHHTEHIIIIAVRQ